MENQSNDEVPQLGCHERDPDQLRRELRPGPRAEPPRERRGPQRTQQQGRALQKVHHGRVCRRGGTSTASECGSSDASSSERAKTRATVPASRRPQSS